MLIGQYEGKLAEKRQVSLPKRFREELGDKLIVTKGFENCLMVVAEEKWKTLLEGTEGRPFTEKNARELQRFFLGSATYVELDAKGRFIIPEYLKEFAQISAEITFVGQDRYVELWDKKRWDEYQHELGGKIDSIAERLSEQG